MIAIMEIYASLLVALLGLVIYLIATNPKVGEVGRIAFFAGLLAFLIGSAGRLLSVIK
jgi:hypothetical protein